MDPRREIRIVEEEDGWWSAVDVESDVASQGETRREALDNLDEALAATDAAEAADGDAPDPDAPWFDS
jgi:predicted RNase H-like HicB family nuclease